MATSRDVVALALELPESERTQVAAEILASLDGAAHPDAEALWANELVRRSESVRNGTAKLVEPDEVFARVEARLAAMRHR